MEVKRKRIRFGTEGGSRVIDCGNILTHKQTHSGLSTSAPCCGEDVGSSRFCVNAAEAQASSRDDLQVGQRRSHVAVHFSNLRHLQGPLRPETQTAIGQIPANKSLELSSCCLSSLTAYQPLNLYHLLTRFPSLLQLRRDEWRTECSDLGYILWAHCIKRKVAAEQENCKKYGRKETWESHTFIPEEKKILAATSVTPQPPSRCTYGINVKAVGDFLPKWLHLENVQQVEISEIQTDTLMVSIWKFSNNW